MFISDIRNEIMQAADDGAAALEVEIQDPQTQDMRAQAARNNMFTAFENEIRNLFPMPGMPAAPGMMAPGMMPMPVAQGMPNPHVNTTLQAVRDVIQQYLQLPAGQRNNNMELDNIIASVMTAIQNEIRNLIPVPGMMPMQGVMPVAPGMPNTNVDMTLQAVRDAIRQYVAQPGNQQNNMELDAIIGEVATAVQNEIRNLFPMPGMGPQPGMMPVAPGMPNTNVDMTLQAVRDAFLQYIAQPGNQQNNQALNDIRDQVLMPFENEIQNPQTQDPRAQMVRNTVLANYVERGHATIADLPADVQNMLRDALDEYNRNHGTNMQMGSDNQN